MLKFVILPFALAFFVLIAVAVFAPRNKEVKKLAENQQPVSVWNVLWSLPVLALLPPLSLFWRGESWDNLSWMLYLLYLVFLAGLGVIGLAWHGGLTFFVAAIPAAQEFGRGLTKEERRATWRRAKREFQKFRAS